MTIDMFELFLDKISSIVLDSLIDGELMKMINDEIYWGEQKPIVSINCNDDEEVIKQYEELYQEFLNDVDQSYFVELAEIEALKREIFNVV